MQFTTPIPIAQSDFPIDYNSRILSLGSCFAVNIAAQFDYYKFENLCNPIGILFHPPAILELVQRALKQHEFTPSDLLLHNGLWHCFDAHSDLSHPDQQTALSNLNAALEATSQYIKTASHLVITYGTAWVYRLAADGKTVANCHKLPQTNFIKSLLSVHEIASAVSETIDLIAEANKNCSIIFTVSPVRHIKDGFVENQQSKAHLIAAVHEARRSAAYFASYEIMIDELRDYRFYDEDMLHPSRTAIEYIWERFAQSNIAAGAHATMQAVADIQKALRHKPFHTDSESHRAFLLRVEQKISALQQEFPQLRF